MIDAPDVVVIGGGQAGLAAGNFLRRTPLSFVILDDGEAPGGAWRHAWDSLTLFSPAQWRSLPGWPMPPLSGGGYPPRDAAVAYLAAYEVRYALPVRRPVHIAVARRDGDRADLPGAEGEAERPCCARAGIERLADRLRVRDGPRVPLGHPQLRHRHRGLLGLHVDRRRAAYVGAAALFPARLFALHAGVPFSALRGGGDRRELDRRLAGDAVRDRADTRGRA